MLEVVCRSLKELSTFLWSAARWLSSLLLKILQLSSQGKKGRKGELYIGLPLTSASCGIFYFFGFQGFDRSLSTSETSFESSITSAATLRTAAEMVTASAGFQPYRPAENTILSPSNSITPFPSAVVNNAIATPTPYAYHPAYFPSAAAAATHLSYG